MKFSDVVQIVLSTEAGFAFRVVVEFLWNHDAQAAGGLSFLAIVLLVLALLVKNIEEDLL